MIIESSDTEKQRKPRSKLFQRIVIVFLGIPALVSTLGYAEYRQQYKEPIGRGVNIGELFTRFYRNHDLKESLLDTIVDSNYDGVTKSWLINLGNLYNDAFQTAGVDGVTEIIDKGAAPSPATISEIITTVDDEQRIEAILIEDHKEKSIQALLRSLDLAEFTDELSEILLKNQEVQNYADFIKQESALRGVDPEGYYSGIDTFSPPVGELPSAIKDRLLKIVYKATNAIINVNGVTIPFGEEEQKTIAEAVKRYASTESVDSTNFLLNILEHKGAGSYLLDSTIDRTFNNISWFFHLLESKDPATLDFFLNRGKVPSEYSGQYSSLILNLLHEETYIKADTTLHDQFTKAMNGNPQLGTLGFFNFVTNFDSRYDAEVPTDIVALEAYIQNYSYVPLIKKHNLTTEEVLFHLEINGSNSRWDEQLVRDVKNNPQMLKLPKEYFYPSDDSVKIQLAYNEKMSALPVHMSTVLKESVYFLMKKYVDRSTTLFSTEMLAKALQAEVIKLGEVDLVKVKTDFSLTDTGNHDEASTPVDVPIIFQGPTDGFLSFDTKTQKVSENLQALSSRELISALSGFHFMYVQDGIEKFGSIADVLSQVGNVQDVIQLIDQLRSLNITSLTRVLPVSWDNDLPLVQGHVVRINSENFTGILLITDNDKKVVMQYLAVIPSYRLSEISKTAIARQLGVKNEQQIELLLPDAGYETHYVEGDSPHIITQGAVMGMNQGIRFLVDKTKE